MGVKIIGIVALLFIVGAVVYVSRTGFLNNPGNPLSFLSFPTSTTPSTSTTFFNNPPLPQPQTAYVPPPVGYPQTIPKGFTASDLSPHYQAVRIGSFSPGFYGGGYSSVVLAAGYNLRDKVSISGWQLKANNGGQYIPRAVAVYDPTGLAGESDIVLESGVSVYLYSTTSPVGKNLRNNKCLGYVANHVTFSPPISERCPQINRSDISGLSGRCQDYILSLGWSCGEPSENPPISNDDFACRAYFDRFSYRGCVEDHHGDVDFFGSEWYVWTGSSFADSRHDSIRLLDQNGKLVDLYEY